MKKVKEDSDMMIVLIQSWAYLKLKVRCPEVTEVDGREETMRVFISGP